MGVDIVSLANNHTLDYGRAALSDTFSALDGAGILYGGAGDSVQRAKEVQIMEVNGKKNMYQTYSMQKHNTKADNKTNEKAEKI